MTVPESVTLLAERLGKELFCTGDEHPSVETAIRPHSDPTRGWVVEVSIKPPHDAMLPLLPTIHRLGHGAVGWDLGRNAVIISGVVNGIPVSLFITRVTDANVRPSHN